MTAIRHFYQDTHGCSPESDIGTSIETPLTYEPVDDLLQEFGVSNRHDVSAEAWARFCTAAANIRSSEVLASYVADQEEEQPEENTGMQALYSEFFQAIHAMRPREP